MDISTDTTAVSENELLKSPLHQLELQTAKARANSPHSPTPASPLKSRTPPLSPSPAQYYPDRDHDHDRDSIYSFDSVSTNGRLLDRLGLESDDLLDTDEVTTLRLERLSISDVAGRPSSRHNSVQLQNPFRSPSIPHPNTNLTRLPSYRANHLFNIHPNLTRSGSTSRDKVFAVDPAHSPDRVLEGAELSPFSVKNGPGNIVYASRNRSVHSLKASFQPETTSVIGATGAISKKKSSVDYNEYDEFDFNSSSDSINASHSRIPHPGAGAMARTRSVSASVNSGSLSREGSTRRSISDYTNTTSSPNGKLAELSPEDRTKLSMELRGQGKQREASYQLQIAANPPFNYPKAMLLYALALKFGNGVKQNTPSSLKWLCRCILLCTNDTPEFASRVGILSQEELVKWGVSHIRSDTTEVDPIKLYDYYSKLPANQITKIVNTIKSQSDPLASAYQELGMFFLNGWGVEKDELLGIQCLSISSSMGNFNSMVQLGEIWGLKTRFHKKDNFKASAWLRLGEIFGAKTIGNSWIYKDKYLKGE
ncbi:hypothetical protein PSN45_002701 [Yamadazyma tenuis]|uniref:Uncharacterized protein n=1 Tax=Candida tenuis (strain ATCC 10573 / BCRC 21748 / CBS 615 / JCM 9827 / NBRC 10315 / NRRL Y-1498 / VKM Y-70) TaxID=590646 RepID=G3AX39_CANTC|nr:uncharacterized protein CANTEDRAFT_91853 [Yamadazyma tenuis ATCC 10573]EGV66682.1 hypothetical protein CANTEDRAFT_91853 [Yamadazyma tenuis ATCC 10573]WEJ95188.1 hypothetical protein PSN45_002701 [Yamadazyma tenuis]